MYNVLRGRGQSMNYIMHHVHEKKKPNVMFLKLLLIGAYTGFAERAIGTVHKDPQWGPTGSSYSDGHHQPRQFSHRFPCCRQSAQHSVQVPHHTVLAGIPARAGQVPVQPHEPDAFVYSANKCKGKFYLCHAIDWE